MSLHHPTPFKIGVVWTLIAVTGALLGWWEARARERVLLNQHIREATRRAIAFDGEQLAGLTGTAADLSSPAYAAVKRRLRRFLSLDPQVRGLSLLRYTPEGPDAADRPDAPLSVRLLADSTATGAPDGVPPGTAHLIPAGAETLRALVQRGRPGVERLHQDSTGKWIRSYALIDPETRGTDAATAKDILALDLDATSWHRDLLFAGLQRAFIVWMLLGLPLGVWLAVRRQLEQREVIRNLSEAMEQSHSAILIVDLDSRIEFANRGLCRQIGYSRREMIGRKWTEFKSKAVPDGTLDLIAAMRAGQTWEGEWSIQRKDGTTFPVRGVVTPVKHRDGSISCFVAVFDDVSETKRREEELRDARDLAEAGDRAKGQFLATMSHEVRTPLNGIVGFTSLLLDTPLSSEQREYVQTIRMSTEALIQLTGDILDFARVESGKLKLDPAACDPRECVEDALDLLATRAAEKKIELLHHIDANVPAAILVDSGRLRQVLVNLVGNAVKFTERGEVEVKVSIAGEAEAGAALPEPGSCVLEFSVRDTGIGIAAEHHAKLFRPFTQVDESTTRRYGGTGLGLAICRNLVELMGGEIRVRSVPGEGSTFWFRLRTAVAAPSGPERKLPGMRLGLAVQSLALGRELAQLLRGWKAHVVECSNPERLGDYPLDMALVEVSAEAAALLAISEPLPGLPPAKTLGLVPISLSNDLRSALRAHFGLLVNRPVHHDALFALLSAGMSQAAGEALRPRFGFRVLVAEDNAVNQRLIMRVLENLGCAPTLVENGRQAVNELRARAEVYDLMLLDLHMPVLDGLEALREIREGAAGARAQSMWIIALTADAGEQQRAGSRVAGLDDFLTKPLNLAELEAALRRFRSEHFTRKD